MVFSADRFSGDRPANYRSDQSLVSGQDLRNRFRRAGRRHAVAAVVCLRLPAGGGHAGGNAGGGIRHVHHCPFYAENAHHGDQRHV